MTAEEPERPRRGATASEPAQPRRGASAEERPPDVSAAEQRLADATTWPARLRAAADPRLVLSQAEGYPPGIKQFLWFCLVLVYPAWLFVVLLMWPAWLAGRLLYGLAWLFFLPVRMWMTKHHPEVAAETQAKFAEAEAKDG